MWAVVEEHDFKLVSVGEISGSGISNSFVASPAPGAYTTVGSERRFLGPEYPGRGYLNP